MHLYLNGRAHDSTSVGDGVPIVDPVAGHTLDQVPVAREPQEAETILSLGEAGLAEWSVKPMWERAAAIQRFADRIDEQAAELAVLMARNMGRAIRECHAEVGLAANLARGFAERAKHLYGDVMPQSQPGLEHDLVFTRREPLGVFLCIVPFNAPIELYVHKAIPALLMGNSVIVKPPMPNPLCHLLLTSMLVDAGVPKSAVQMLYADAGFTSTYVTKSARIAAVTFTGSTAAGMAVNRDCADARHHVFLEMGGNDPFIVMEGADLDEAATQLVNSRMMNSGQVCCSSKRTLVSESVADAFTEKVAQRVKQIVQGDPLDPNTQVGALVTPDAARRVKQQVDAAVADGARCLVGGTVQDDVFFEPTLLVDVHKDMEIAKDAEIFGPVISILRYSSLDEAVEVANQTSYGLQASILAEEIKPAMAVASQLHVGMVVVNGAGSYRHIDMPFGGSKASGSGREGISRTLDEFSQEKSYVLKDVLE